MRRENERRKAFANIDEDQLLGRPLKVNFPLGQPLKVDSPLGQSKQDIITKRHFKRYLDGFVDSRGKDFKFKGVVFKSFEDAVAPEAPDWNKALVMGLIKFYIQTVKPNHKVSLALACTDR